MPRNDSPYSEEREILQTDALHFARQKYSTSPQLSNTSINETEPLVKRVHFIDPSKLDATSINGEPPDGSQIEIIGGTGMLGSIFPLTNTIVGAGTLTLPYTFAVTGMVTGTILLLSVAILCSFSAHLLIISSEYSRGVSYKDLAVSSFGKWGGKIVELSLILLTFGMMSAYLVVIKDLLPSLIHLITSGVHHHDIIWTDTRFLLAVIVISIIIPLALIKRISTLRYTSILSLFSILYLVSIVMSKSIIAIIRKDVTFTGISSDDVDSHNQVELFHKSARLLVALPILSMAYSFHMNVAPIYSELHNSTPQKMQKVCNIAVGIASFVYILTATFGYLNFRQETNSNILTNYPHGDIPVVIANVALIAVVCFTYPLINYPLRSNILTLLFRNSNSIILHIIITLTCVGGSYGVAILGLDLGFIFGLVGSTVGILLIFILPCAYYIKLSPASFISVKKILATLLLTVGISLSAICTWSVIHFKQ